MNEALANNPTVQQVREALKQFTASSAILAEVIDNSANGLIQAASQHEHCSPEILREIMGEFVNEVRAAVESSETLQASCRRMLNACGVYRSE